MPATISLRAQRGDTLVEVLISTLLLVIVAIATLNGLNAVSKASALGRARSQAQALAEQDEERLRSEPISAIEALNGNSETRTVRLGGTTYTVYSRVELVTENGSSLCAASNPTSGVYRTTSEVTWWGGHGDHHLAETSSIPPPPGAALLVQVEGAAKGEPVAGMEATLTGPSPSTTLYTHETTSNGCAIFGPFETGGEYTLNIRRSGYVDSNNYATVAEDPTAQTVWTLLGSTLAKAGFRFAEAGRLTVHLTTAPPPAAPAGWSAVTAVPNVVIANSSMHPETRLLAPTNGAYATVESQPPYLFPYTYAVFPGTCAANNPEQVAENPAPAATVTSGSTTTAEVMVPAAIVRVYRGTTVTEADLVPHPTLVLTDQQCVPPLVIEESEAETLSETSQIAVQGDLARPGVPAGVYAVCTEWTAGTSTVSVTAKNQHIPIHGKQYAEINLLREAEVPEANVKSNQPCER